MQNEGRPAPQFASTQNGWGLKTRSNQLNVCTSEQKRKQQKTTGYWEPLETGADCPSDRVRCEGLAVESGKSDRPGALEHSEPLKTTLPGKRRRSKQ